MNLIQASCFFLGGVFFAIGVIEFTKWVKAESPVETLEPSTLLDNSNE